MTDVGKVESIKRFLGAFLVCFVLVVVADNCVSLLQREGGSNGTYGLVAGILIGIAVAALAVSLIFGNRWVRAERLGASLGAALAISLVMTARYLA